MTSSGIKYSNIEPLQLNSAGTLPALVSRRPSANQCSWPKLPCAMTMKLASRASEASRS